MMMSARLKSKAELVISKEEKIVEEWIQAKRHQLLIRNHTTVYAWPESLANDMNIIFAGFKVIYSGVRVGDLMKDKLIPDHALAMSDLVNEAIVALD